MHEIELRFHVPSEQRERLRRFLDSRSPAARTPLAAIYFDTADRALARAGIGLRLRREGGRWVQTCKGPAEDGMTRLEHNAPLAPRAPVVLDLTRHAEHPLGEQLAALQARGLAELRPVFRTEIRRAHRVQRMRGGRLELCWDEGKLLAGEGAAAASLPVHELELELLSGDASALLAHAHGLVSRLPLSLDLRSKAERGERLAQGQTQRPAAKSTPLRLLPAMQPGEALRAMLLNTFAQVAGNASQVGCGDNGPEHVHQLRVGLRRLRSGLRLFRGIWAELEHGGLLGFEQQAAAWFRQLGAVRDADVMATGLSPALRAAMHEALPGRLDPAAAPASGDGGGAAAAAHCVRQSGPQQFLLEWLGWLDALARNPALVALPPPVPGVESLSLRRGLKRRLTRWHRQVQRECARFAELEPEARHQLRKRFKRLRYGSEFCQHLFDAKQLAEGLKPILKAQELLGELNDIELALSDSRARIGQDPQAWFEVGWLAARRSALLERTEPVMAAVAKGPALLRKR
jgi:inorganic triphosphatase YgiF